MLEIRERAEGHDLCDVTLTLPFEERQRSRLRVVLSSGEHAALGLPRGSVLRGGDLLRMSDGRLVKVIAAEEAVSTVRSPLPRALARAAYHLGNRHVPLEVGEGYLRYLHDHVLDALVCELGLTVRADRAPFEPEGGAYDGARGHRVASHTHGHHQHGHLHNQENLVTINVAGRDHG
jgi:urease accessory protein